MITATRLGERSAPVVTGARTGRVVTVVVELMVAAAALYGGVGLIWSNRIGMRGEWLEGTPFNSWTLPGVLLLLVVAAPMLSAALFEARRSAWASVASVAAGSAQVAWIAAQLLVFQRYFVLQPLMIGCGLLVVLLTLFAHRDVPVDPRTRMGADR